MDKLNTTNTSTKTPATGRPILLLTRVGVILLLIGLIGGLIFGAYSLAHRFLSTADSTTQNDTCTHTGIEYRAIIKNNTITPKVTTAKLCDRLTIINDDQVNRLMAFGLHDKHVTYDGITTQQLRSGQSFSITLVQPGTYLFHDHFDDGVEASFTVTK